MLSLAAGQLGRRCESLAKIGMHMHVDAGTVARALHKAGVALRDCHGRER